MDWQEYEEVKGSFNPQQQLEGIELELFRLYKYATTKMDGSGDPRTSLRTVFLSKVNQSMLLQVECMRQEIVITSVQR